MARSQNAQEAMAITKPTMHWRVSFIPLGATEPQEFKAGTLSAAVKFATSVMKVGAYSVLVQEHDGNGWLTNEPATTRAIQNVRGAGNGQAVIFLQQLNELTLTLMKEASKKNGVTDETARAWLDQIFLACQALGITPSAIAQTIGNTYDLSQVAVTPEQQ